MTPESTIQELREQLSVLMKEEKYPAVREILIEKLPPDIAELIHSLSGEDKAVVFRFLPTELATKTFEHLDTGDQKALLEGLGSKRFAVILNEMAADDRTKLLGELPAQAVRKLVSLLNREQREEALELLGYPEHSVGRLMAPDYIAVEVHWTGRQVLDYMRAHGTEKDSFHVIYVVNKEGTLLCDIKIRDLLLNELDAPVSHLVNRSFVALKVNDDQEVAVKLFKKYDRSVVPVVDDHNHMLGVVTVDDIMDVAEREVTEDMHKLGGVQALSDPYMKVPLVELIRKRANWLVILFVGEMLTATAMGYFEKEIQRAVVLALFIPLIISSGGNSGSQASTLIIRALAVGEVSASAWLAVLKRELVSGFVLGLILGVIGFLRITIWSQFGELYGPHWLLVGVSVGLSLVAVVLWGAIAGSMLPFVLKRFGADPATSSAPFVATLVDVTGLVLYFTIAAIILGHVVM